jgi:hypothetical protein
MIEPKSTVSTDGRSDGGRNGAGPEWIQDRLG